MEKIKQRIITISSKRIHIGLLFYVFKWIVLGGGVGILVGSASAFFLASLDWATKTQQTYSWLLFLLPIGGAFVSLLYWKFGQNSSKGNNLIIEQAHGAKESVPFRMAPLVLFGTIVTHLFGGSAGREGTAVQIGGAFSELVGKLFKLDEIDRKIIMICGISSGFGSVFGTPLAGTVFGLEVLAIGLIRHEAIFPSFVAAFVGDIVTSAWGIHHHLYHIGNIPELSWLLIVKIIIASILFGLTSTLFSELTHWLKKTYTKLFPNPVVKSFMGGLIVIILVYIVGTRQYLGLGIPLIDQAFDGTVSLFTFLLKLIFTALTLGAGFQGGEVTPLFVVGSTLGSALGDILYVSAPFLAALGFIGVFCGATNTPIACFIMGIELFGSEASVYLFIACIVSYLFSGHTGIYTSQQIEVSKNRWIQIPKQSTLASVKKKRMM
ncbi:voltage-gated chloride channel family protein [Bacillus sp. (in: firmicutes)]|uniref:voltage-gated chloride channel family protein n=1 Tax=Bacillus sp. TaxID=1409 RepID=UPI000789DEAB|nr:voltage-gated chloride channel family protein [Bacillus sp. (in: firmicutes)]KYQ03959.1 Chloride channel protein [Bacillus cereus]MDU2391320.1 voltage-gated chloride channel family protein [Bacillus sp. (in: firmicutes)]